MPTAKDPSEPDDYFEQDDEEREAAGRRKSLAALAILAVLVVGGIFLAHELRKTSELQDCLMTKATNCIQIDDTGQAIRR
jgi:hypothetical protein